MKKRDISVLYLVAFILILALLISILTSPKESDILKYKKDIYKSILCQYSCPLIKQEFQNKSQFLPSKSCVENCTEIFRTEQQNPEKITAKDLSKDSLILDMDKAIRACTGSISQNSTSEEASFNFFLCSRKSLEDIKANYSYLNEQ